jgi:effector-binding domain-containing protein
VPASRVAVTTFDGPPLDLDRAYGALGRWVLEQASASEGPVRERYLPTGDEDDLLAHATEVCWPVASR